MVIRVVMRKNQTASVTHLVYTAIAGVDIVVDVHGDPFVLEVNAVPGWRALTHATGVDVAVHIMSWLAEQVTTRKRK